MKKASSSGAGFLRHGRGYEAACDSRILVPTTFQVALLSKILNHRTDPEPCLSGALFFQVRRRETRFARPLCFAGIILLLVQRCTKRLDLS
jgi:hypothetical protein